MKRLVRVFLAGTAITLGFGQIVSAADLPVKAPVAPVAAPDWTGFYIGLNTGGSIGTGSASENAAFNSAAIGANELLNAPTAPHRPGGSLAVSLDITSKYQIGSSAWRPTGNGHRKKPTHSIALRLLQLLDFLVPERVALAIAWMQSKS